jgi:hypothetical protein
MAHKRRLTPLRLVVLTAALLLALGILAGCGASPTATVEAPPTPTPVPTAAVPDDWVEHEGGDFSIGLPQAWQVQEFSQGDMETIFAEMQKTNPQMAAIIGSAEQLQGVALWAFAPVEDATSFVDNLNIRRTPLEGQEVGDLSEVTDILVEQYQQLNFEEVTAQADLEIGGFPAAYATYLMPLATADGSQVKIQGHQYLVLTGTDLWILSYSFGPDSADTSIHEQSAQSFATN